jgi:hypothetical protein
MGSRHYLARALVLLALALAVGIAVAIAGGEERRTVKHNNWSAIAHQIA